MCESSDDIKKGIDKLYMRSACENCPFRKDEQGIQHLGKKRAEQIARDNHTDGFVCHKTTYGKKVKRQCAGALILAKKTETRQPFLDMYESMFGEMELLNQDMIVDSEQEFISKQV